MTPVIVQSSDEQPVRAIRQVERGEHQDRFPMPAAIHDDRRDRSGGAGHHEAGGAPQEVVPPHLRHSLTCGQSDCARDQSGVHDKICGDGADQGRGEIERRDRPDRSAEPDVDGAGGDHRERLGGRAENRAIERISPFYLERALRPGAGHRDRHRVARPEQEQRHQIRGIGHRQRRAARQRNRQVHLPDRCHTREHDEHTEQDRLAGRCAGRTPRTCSAPPMMTAVK